MPSKTKILTLNEFIQLFKDDSNSCSTSKYCFLLGAGASVPSGIPSANTLAKKWYEEISKFLDKDQFIQWQEAEKIDKDNLASSYSPIYERRFQANPANGYAEIQKQLENKEPSIGYAFFAKILAETPHRFVITTNFDSLIEDALFIYTKTKPLVCGHESLASYINVHGSRPTIVKIHRDVLLDPISDCSGTNDLKEQWQKALKPLLSAFNLVVIGYGGNDGSLMNYLKDLKEDRKPIYWCVRDIYNINDDIKEALKDDDFFVKIDGFDELMVELSSAYNLKIEKDEIVKNAQIRMQKFDEELKKFGKEVKEKADKSGEEISQAIKEVLPSWFEYVLKAEREKDPIKQNEIYKIGIQQLPNSAELSNHYAVFLKNICKDYDGAEKYYKRSLELNPDEAMYNNNYGAFLHYIRKDYDGAEKYYKRSLELNPDEAVYNGNYGTFLQSIYKEYDKAIKHHKKALEFKPDHINININFAQLLLILGMKEEAKIYLQKTENLLLNIQGFDDAKIELWFYRLAHFSEYYEEAKKNIEQLLKEGVRSIGWDFSQNIEQAKREGNTHTKELQAYADEITKEKEK
ncbi:MAG: hypothetical protein H6Q35_1271 [Proteobacteria bacterium]|nr:hypothetical protein [Pseudomonadota bacterium]